jgi:hypothetical protein
VPAGLGVLYANAAGGLDFGTIGAGLVIWVVLTSAIKLFGDQRDTPSGAEAAARWLGVRDHLGRNEVFPTLPRRRWPSGTGIWATAPPTEWPRRRCMPCRWGAEDDHRALMLGLRGWTAGYAEADHAARWVRTASTLLAVAAPLVAGWGVWTILWAVLDLVSRREVEGQVVRRRSYSRGNTSSTTSWPSTPAARTRSGLAGPGGRVWPLPGG